MPVARSTTIRDKHRAIIRRDTPPCGICGGPIDYDLPHLDPGAYTVDHIIPLAKGGEDALPNKQAAHRHPLMQPSEVASHQRGLRAATHVRD